MMQAIAPEANAVQAQGDAARRQQAASGTARGGGTAGANQTAKDAEMARIDNALFGVRPGAVAQEQALGTTQMSQGLQFAGLGATGASNAGSIATSAREQAMKAQAAAIQMATGAIFG
jgi:hypothetical protein